MTAAHLCRYCLFGGSNARDIRSVPTGCGHWPERSAGQLPRLDAPKRGRDRRLDTGTSFRFAGLKAAPEQRREAADYPCAITWKDGFCTNQAIMLLMTCGISDAHRKPWFGTTFWKIAAQQPHRCRSQLQPICHYPLWMSNLTEPSSRIFSKSDRLAAVGRGTSPKVRVAIIVALPGQSIRFRYGRTSRGGPIAAL
jgi:hypothetical protein